MNGVLRSLSNQDYSKEKNVINLHTVLNNIARFARACICRSFQ